ncbi:FAD-dependent oxidoreductase [Solilutibacter silvestris]|uniref:Kynurenine 3-monooxygenase n=1 Tax=Solilutibacter silvestris TaxID=1645665 RepID=A0A2K1PYQ7_9GAMM|nr:NAD(P)/FAD-dependent oxidoreductase [Lysobacter silvestris]PNS07918.1 2-polyprenyl-6-methoxyphenol hydroxylase and related FAD-dependent oxidoreductase [Lysobacter silvestris]
MTPPASLTTPLAIIGGGLAGALLATLLAKQGWQVDVYERRGDPRVEGYAGGRSINLALAERGLHALRLAGLDDAVLKQAVMMRGRFVHPLDGEPHLQRYGRDDSEVIWSISRGELNITLLDAAERAGARLHFDMGLESVDFERRIATFDTNSGPRELPFTTLIGADGAGSSLRQALQHYRPCEERSEWLDHGYKELEIPPDANGDFRIEANALHIWPRGHYMCIALPNDERTFTVTLFMPLQGAAPSFETIRDGAQALDFFHRDFPDAIPLIPELVEDYARNPVGKLATLHYQHWHLDDRAALIGDAAHAMVPFHGQGMNCAFEDCIALANHLARDRGLAEAYAAYEAERKPNAAAIQQMALENYIEMRDKVGDAAFLLQRELELALQARHPGRFVPHYTMVTFMRIPYAMALERSDIQREILVNATRGRESLDGIDWAAVDGEVMARLEPLPG